MSIWIVLKLIGSLALLMFGMKTTSDSLQRIAGSQLRHALGAMSTNRFTAMLTGIFVTAAVQSSTATTLMTVSFVNAGLLSLLLAIAVIMGAHIGTTVTAWVMCLGFSTDTLAFVYPAFLLGIILIYQKKHRLVGDLLFGIAILFLGLATLRSTGQEIVTLDTEGAIKAFFQQFQDNSFWNSFIFLALGTVLTLCVQSSAAIMALTMTLCATGVLHIEQGIMLVLGENIGTTITTNIVAMRATTQARRAAFAHLSINVVGVVWVLILLRPFFSAVCSVVGFQPDMPASAPDYSIKSAVVLATFHTAFNVCNTMLQILFVPQIERFVCWMIKPHEQEEKEDTRLHFITSGLMKTPELSLLEAQKEIRLFAERTQYMFSMVQELLEETDKEKFAKLFSRIEEYEDLSDNMEIEIAKYLNNVSNGHLSDDTKAKIRAMLREISELESIGDACYNIARTLNRRAHGKEDFTDEQYSHIHQMMGLADEALSQMNIILSGRKEKQDLHRSFNLEDEIDNYRNQLRIQNVNDVNEHKYTYSIGTMYMDIVSECEQMGDYILNVVEARMNTRQYSA